MNQYTRLRAEMALMNCHPAKDLGGDHFAKVWVVGSNIFFTRMAAMRDLMTKKNLEPTGGPWQMEEVTIEEALKTFPDKPEKPQSHTVCKDLMEGSLYAGNKLFNHNRI